MMGKKKVAKKRGGGSMLMKKAMGGSMVKKKAGGGSMVKKRAMGGSMVKKKANGGSMKQGFKDRKDESIAMRVKKKRTPAQLKASRNESYGKFGKGTGKGVINKRGGGIAKRGMGIAK